MKNGRDMEKNYILAEKNNLTKEACINLGKEECANFKNSRLWQDDLSEFYNIKKCVANGLQITIN